MKKGNRKRTGENISANTPMDNDVTPVYLAAQEGHLDVLKFLVLEAGGSLFVRAKDGMAPIHAASQMGCLNCVKWMIQEQGIDPNLRDSDGATPLHFAASKGHLETVRWLLNHGAKLSLDKYGKSPINDAAENQQAECLNILIQHGTTPDISERAYNKRECISTKLMEQPKKIPQNNCGNCVLLNIDTNQEPFYLHPPSHMESVESPHAPQDGLYVNPMTSCRHSNSSISGNSTNDNFDGESFYLHNPQELVYTRVKDIFEKSLCRLPTASALTVKVEVHSGSSESESEVNFSSSEMSEKSDDNDHDYEDVFFTEEEFRHKIKDKVNSVKWHNRPHFTSRNSNIEDTYNMNNYKNEENNSQQNKDSVRKAKETEEDKLLGTNNKLASDTSFPKHKLEKNDEPLSNHHSLLHIGTNNLNSKPLKWTTSNPGDAYAPPPPPPLPLGEEKQRNDAKEKLSNNLLEAMDIEEPTLKPSDIMKKNYRSTPSLPIPRRHNSSSCSDLTIINLEDNFDKPTPHLVNKQRVLPFIPPSFPGSNDSINLIKPSEYLKSINDRRSSTPLCRSSSDYKEIVASIEERNNLNTLSNPPPPPLPQTDENNTRDCSNFSASGMPDITKKHQQPLSSISIHDLNSVQLRRTEKSKLSATKTLSAPTRSSSLQCLQSESFVNQKTNLIAELKLSKDIYGIKKMKIEKAKVEQLQEKALYSEISRQFNANNFVEKIPDRDNSGNVIPAWKRQILAKKSAEKAKRELEEQLQREAEEKKLQSMPQWKRNLLAKKEETENKIKSTIYTPKLLDDLKQPRAPMVHECLKLQNGEENKSKEMVGSSISEVDDYKNVLNGNFEEIRQNNYSESNSEQNIMPWRAQLKKTHSSLNLLE